MPELPEVETVKRMIEPVLLGQTVQKVRFNRMDLRYPFPKAKLRRIARSGKIESLERRGKYLTLNFPAGDWVIHLGMSGNFHLDKPKSKHIHVEIETSAGNLYYEDPRRFGFFDAISKQQRNKHLEGKGPDAWLNCPSGEAIFKLSRGVRTAVKIFLMNQNYFMGIGNIYACEMLFLTNISPTRASNRLTRQQCAALSNTIPQVLQEAINHCGTSFDSFRTPDGQQGEHFQYVNVYNKAGEPCKRCGSIIKHKVQQGRITYYCSVCQQA